MHFTPGLCLRTVLLNCNLSVLHPGFTIFWDSACMQRTVYFGILSVALRCSERSAPLRGPEPFPGTVTGLGWGSPQYTETSYPLQHSAGSCSQRRIPAAEYPCSALNCSPSQAMVLQVCWTPLQLTRGTNGGPNAPQYAWQNLRTVTLQFYKFGLKV